MTIITSICFVYMIGLLAFLLYKFFSSDGHERLKFLKSFKRGKFALIYISALPLYIMGGMYGGMTLGTSVLKGLQNTIELVILKFNAGDVANLMKDNLFFRITMSLCFSLVIINTVVFTITLFAQKNINKLRLFNATHFEETVYVIVGNNERNFDILKSIKVENPKTAVIFLADLNKEVEDKLFVLRTPYSKFKKGGNLAVVLEKLIKNPQDKLVRVIVNTNDDNENLLLTKQCCDMILQYKKEFSLDYEFGFHVYVFGEIENSSAFEYFVEKTKSYIRYVNRHRLVAMDFISKHSITEDMNENMIDYDKALLKPNVEPNVIMIGFGKSNQRLFSTSVANNQFLTEKDGKVDLLPVSYAIYDKIDSKNDKNLNHSYNRYKLEFLNVIKDRNEYFDIVDEPAKVSFNILDINDLNFYNCVKENLTPKEGNIAQNQIIIAFGDDLQNLDLAEKFSIKLLEWGLGDCTKLYVKIKNHSLAEGVLVDYRKEKGIIAFGDESETVYNVNQIVNEKAEKMAKCRHYIYSVLRAQQEEDKKKEAIAQLAKESSVADMTDNQNNATEIAIAREDEKLFLAKADTIWFEGNDYIRRVSNTYACLSIRLKLNLLGYDYCDLEDERKDASKEFLEKYQEGDPIVYNKKYHDIVEYPVDFIENTKRNNLAKQEHQRWNAYMITCGSIPSSKTQVKEEGRAKNEKQRRHANIATYDGLIEYRKFMAELENKSEKDTDIIKYDYQLMDDVVWILGKNGYKIVKKGA